MLQRFPKLRCLLPVPASNRPNCSSTSSNRCVGHEFLSLSCPSHVLLRSLFSLGTDALMTDNGGRRRRQERCGAPRRRHPTTARPVQSTRRPVSPAPPTGGGPRYRAARSLLVVTMQWALVSLGLECTRSVGVPWDEAGSTHSKSVFKRVKHQGHPLGLQAGWGPHSCRAWPGASARRQPA